MEGGRGAVPMAAAELRKLQRRWGSGGAGGEPAAAAVAAAARN